MVNKNKLVKIILFAVLLATLRYIYLLSRAGTVSSSHFWSIRSIDVMKYSRDLAREKLNSKSFDEVIDKQMADVASTGASHVAIGVPYDQEFLPIMHRWVYGARNHGLKVWFRGNFSGWEQWFEYKKIDSKTHTQMVGEFIVKNADLFEDGDLFSSCPECENGGSGDPRHVGGVEEYRNFLVAETDMVRQSFRKIGKDIPNNLHSMNGDVAKLIMNRETTKRLGGIVVIDHYVATPEKLISDIKMFADISGGEIVLGEFGAPIPDIHGSMSEAEQANWIDSALSALSQDNLVVGINYWTSFGGSTRLWNDDGTPRLAVKTVTNYFSPRQISSRVITWFGIPVSGAQVYLGRFSGLTAKNGYFSLPDTPKSRLEVVGLGFRPYSLEGSVPQKIYIQPASLTSFLRYFIFG